MTEHERALMEAHRISSLDAYMEARPVLNTPVESRVFEAGHDAGWKNCADRLAAENAELKQKLFKAETERGVMFEEYDKQTATIEALQLRIARLVDALNSISATTGEYLLFTAKSTDLSKEYHKARKSLSAEGDQQWLREKQAELTEAAIDAPRGFFMGLELGCKDLESMRAHLDRCGYDYSCWPAWAKEETGHITKAGKAILVFTMMASELRQQKEVKP